MLVECIHVHVYIYSSLHVHVYEVHVYEVHVDVYTCILSAQVQINYSGTCIQY